MEKYTNRKWTFALILCVAVLVLSLCFGVFAFAAEGGEGEQTGPSEGATVKSVAAVADESTYSLQDGFWREKAVPGYYAFTKGMNSTEALNRITGVTVTYSDGFVQNIAKGDLAECTLSGETLTVKLTADDTETYIAELNFQEVKPFALVLSDSWTAPSNLTSTTDLTDLGTALNFTNETVKVVQTNGVATADQVLLDYISTSDALTPTSDYLKKVISGEYTKDTPYSRTIAIKATQTGITQLGDWVKDVSLSIVIEGISYVAPITATLSADSYSTRPEQFAQTAFNYDGFNFEFEYEDGAVVTAPAQDYAEYCMLKLYRERNESSLLTGTTLTVLARFVKVEFSIPRGDGTTIDGKLNSFTQISVKQGFLNLPQLDKFNVEYQDGGISVKFSELYPNERNPIKISLNDKTFAIDSNGESTIAFEQGGVYEIKILLENTTTGDYQWAGSTRDEIKRSDDGYTLTYTVTVSGAPVTLAFTHDATKEYGDVPIYSFDATVEGSPSMNFGLGDSKRVKDGGDPFKQNATNVNEKPNFRLVYSVVNGNGELNNNNKYETPTATGTYEVYVETAETPWYRYAKSEPVDFEITKRTIPVGAIKTSAEFTGKEFSASDVIDLAASGKALADGDKINDVLSLTADKTMLLVDEYGITLALNTEGKGANYVLLDGTTESESITKTFNIVAAKLSFTAYAHKTEFTYGDSIADYLKTVGNLTIDKTNLKGFADVDLDAVTFCKDGETTPLTTDSKTWEVGSYVAKYPTKDLKTVDGAAANKEYNLPEVEVEFTIQPKAVSKVTLTKDGNEFSGDWSSAEGTNYIWQYGTNLVSTLNQWLTGDLNLAPDGKDILTVSVAGTRLLSTTAIDVSSAISGDKITLNQAGDYVVTVALNSNYKWNDGDTNNTLTFYGAIYKAYVSALGFSDTDNETIYNGEEQTVQAQFALSGETDAGWHNQFFTAPSAGVLNITAIVGKGYAAEGLTLADFTVTNGGFKVKNAGTYTVTVAIADTDNYTWNDSQTGETRKIVYTVNRAPLKGSWNYTDPYQYVEGDEPQQTPEFTLELFGDDATKIGFSTTLYSDDAYTTAISGNKITTAGTFYIAVTDWTASVAGDKTYLNYYLPTEGTELEAIRCKFVITPSGLTPITLTTDDPSKYTITDNNKITFIYWGQGVRLSDFIADKTQYFNGEKYYIVISVDGSTTNDLAMKKAATYTVTVKPAPNYKWNTTGDNAASSEQQEYEFTVVINPLAVELTWSDTSMTYGDEQAQAVAVVNNKAAADDDVNVTVKYKNSASDKDYITIGSTTGANKYVAVATELSDKNYTLTGGSNLSTDYFVYKKGIAKPQYNGSASGTYNGSAQTTDCLYSNSDSLWAAQLSAAVTGKYPASWFDDDKRDVAHTTSASFAVADGRLTYTSAGWYSVTFTVNDSANYCWSGSDYETDKAVFGYSGNYTCEWNEFAEIARAEMEAPKLGEYRAMQRDQGIKQEFVDKFNGYNVKYGKYAEINDASKLSDQRQDLTADKTGLVIGKYFVVLTLDEAFKYDYQWVVPYDNEAKEEYLGAQYATHDGQNVYKWTYSQDGSFVYLYYAITASQVDIEYTLLNNGQYTFGDNGAGYWNAATSVFTAIDNPLVRGGDKDGINGLFTLTNHNGDAEIAKVSFAFTKGGEAVTVLSNGLPWEEGTYIVTITIDFADEDTYQQWQRTYTITVLPLKAAIAWQFNGDNVQKDNISTTYNGEGQLPTAIITNMPVKESSEQPAAPALTLNLSSSAVVNAKTYNLYVNALDSDNANTHNFTLGDNKATDYATTFVINQATLTVKGKAVSHVYGDPLSSYNVASNYSIVSGLCDADTTKTLLKVEIQNADGSVMTDTLQAVVGGEYYVVPALLDLNGNYTLTVEDKGTFTVTKRGITVTVKDGVATSKYGDNPVDLNGSAYYTLGGKGLPSGVAATAVFNLYVTDVNSTETTKPNVTSASIVGSYPIAFSYASGADANYNVTLNEANYVIINADITGVNATGYSDKYDGEAHEALLSKSALVKNSQTVTWFIGFTGITGNNDAQKGIAADTDVTLSEYVVKGDAANGLVRNVLQSGWYKVQAKAQYHNDSEVVLVYVDITKATLTISANLSIYFGEYGPENYNGANGKYQMTLGDLRNALLNGHNGQTALDNSVYTVSGLMASDVTDFRGSAVIDGSVSYGYAQGVTYTRGSAQGSYNLAVDVSALTSDNYSFAAGESVLTVRQLPVTVTVNDGNDYTATYGTTPTKLTVEADVAFATEQMSGYADNGTVSLEGLDKSLLASGISTDAYVLDGDGKVTGTNIVKYDGDAVVGYDIVVTLTGNCVLAAGSEHTNTYVIERANNAYTDTDYTLFATNTADGKDISTNVTANIGVLGYAWTYGDYNADTHALGYDPDGKNALKDFNLSYRGTALTVTVYRNDIEIGSTEIAATDNLNAAIDALFGKIHKTDKAFNAGEYKVVYAMAQSGNYNEFGDTWYFNVAKQALTVTAADMSVTYGNGLDTATVNTNALTDNTNGYYRFTVEGLVSNGGTADTFGGLDITMSFGSSYQAGYDNGSVGTYVISDAATHTHKNYAISQVNGTLTVNPRAITVEIVNLDNFFNLLLLRQEGGSYSYMFEEAKELQFILKSGSFAAGDSEGVIELSKETLFTKQSVFVLNTQALTAVSDGDNTNNAGNYPIYATAGAHYVSKCNSAENNYVITVNGALTAPEGVNAIGINAGRFTIKPAQIRSELSQGFTDNTYDGQSKPYNLQTNLPAGVNVDFVANYYKYANGEYTGDRTELGTNAPVNAGYYRVEFRPVSNPNYVSSSLGQNYSISKATITIGTGETTNSKGYSSGTENGISGVYFNGGEFIRSVIFSGLQNGEKINLSWEINRSLYQGQSIGTLGLEEFLTCTPTLGDNAFSFTVRNAGQYSVTVNIKDGEETNGKKFLAENYTLNGNATLSLNVLRETLTITSNNTQVEYGSQLTDNARFDGFNPTYTLGHLAENDAKALLKEENETKRYLQLKDASAALYTTDYAPNTSKWGGSYNLSFNTGNLDAYNFVVATANDTGNITIKARNITVTVKGYPENSSASCTYAGTHDHNDCLQAALKKNKGNFFTVDYKNMTDPSDFASYTIGDDLDLRIATDRYSAGSTPMLPTESSDRYAITFVNAAGDALSTSNIGDNTGKLSYEILPKTLHVVLIQKGGELVTDGVNQVTIPYGTDAASMLAIKFYGWVEGEGTDDGTLNITNNNVTVTGYDLNGYAAWTSIAGAQYYIKPVVNSNNGNYAIDVETIQTQLTVDSLVLNETVKNVYYKELGTDDAPNYNNGVSGAERRIDISFTYGNGLTLPANAAPVTYKDIYGLGDSVYPTKAGTYSATVTFQQNDNGELNYKFADGVSKTFTDWQVLKKPISLDWSAPSVIVGGDSVSKENTVANFVKSIMEIDSFNHNSTSIKDGDTYTATDKGLTLTVNGSGRFDLTVRFNSDAEKNYEWADGTVGSKVILFTAILENNKVTLEVEIADITFGNNVNITKQKVINAIGSEVPNAAIVFTYANVNYTDGMANGVYAGNVNALTFNAIPRSAGWYVARAYYGGDGSYGAGVTYYLFQIEKATVNKPTFTANASVYNGTTLTAALGYNTQLVFIREYTDNHGISGSDYVTTSSGATVRALNAGGYTIKLALRDADNYAWAEDVGELDDNAVVITWNITAASANEIIWSKDNEYEVDYGTPFVATATATYTSSVQYAYAPTGGVALDDASSITDWGTVRPSQHGTYFVRAYCAGTNNYNEAKDYMLITINKATLFATAKGTMTYEDKWADGKFTYVITDANGNVSNITFTEGQLTYVLTDANLNKDALSVGSYDVKLETSGGIVTGLTNANYQVKLAERLGKVTVSPRRINVTIGDAQGYYGETPDMSKVSITVLEQWTGDVKSILGLELNPNATATANVGSYQITATKTNANYEVTFRNGWYTVRPLNVSVALEQGGGVYGGNIKDVRVKHIYKIEDDGNKTDIGVDALDFVYRYTGTTYGGSNVNQTFAPSLAGQYIASIVAIKDSDRYNKANYNLDLNAGEISVPFTVSKKSVDAGRLIVENAPYTNSNIKPTVTVPSDDEAQAMFYYTDGAATKLVYTQDDQAFKTVGLHTFYLTLVDPDNYEWLTVTTAQREMTFRIVKAQNSLVTEGGETKPIIIADWTFGQTANAPTATIKYGDSAQIVFEYSKEADKGYSYNVPTSAGTYYVRATMPADDNYEAFTSAPVQFTINKARLTSPTLTFVTEGEAKNDVYTGKRLFSTVVGYDSLLMRPFYDADKVTVNAIGNSVTVVATDAGTYTVTFALADPDNYCYANGANEVTLNWTISRQKVELPTANNNTYIVNGKDLVYTPNGFDSSIMNIEGNVTAYGGNFTATVTLKDTANYEWADDPNRVDVKFEWSVIGINVVFIVIICVVSGACVALAVMAAIQAIRHRGRKRAEARAIDERSKADGWTGKEPEQETASAETAQDKTETETK